MLIASLLGGQVAHAQITPTVIDSAEVAKLDERKILDFDELGWEGGRGGSGDGEEPPGYDGDWWYDLEGLRRANDFHTGDDLGEYAEDIVKLTISSVNGGAIPKAVGALRNLRVLEIDFATDKPLPSGIWSLPKLEVLVLRPWGSCNISPQIGRMKMLRELVIYGETGQTVQLPAEIGQLKSLERLLIVGCKLPADGLNVSQLRNLRNLNLNGTGLKAIPKGFENLAVLDSLSLSGNALTTIPEGIGKLKVLKFLDLSENQLSSLPKEIGLLANLLELNLELNQLAHLPESIGRLSQLRHVDLSTNLIAKLPDSIGGMSSLTMLELSSNRLATLPKSIGELQRLGSLYLRDNPMTDLPAEFANLSSLQLLYIDKMGLLGLPRETWDFINRFGGKFSSVPMEIAGRPLAYYLGHPGIDPYSKRYIQGDLALFFLEGFGPIQDSLSTNNPETAPFYLYLFARHWKPLDSGDGWHGLRSLFGSEKVATAFILNHPCEFITEVKNGQYQDLYVVWVSTCKYLLMRGYPKYSDLFHALRAKMQPVCGNRYEADLLQMVKDLKNE